MITDGNFFVSFYLHVGQRKALDYLAEGHSFFGSSTPERIEDLRAIGLPEMAEVSAEDLYLTFHFAAWRLGSYARIERLHGNRVKSFRVISDGCPHEVCAQLHGKVINVAAAASALERLLKLDPCEQGLELAKRVVSSKTPHLPNILEGNRIKDQYVIENYTFPPFFPGCQCRVKGIQLTLERDL